MGENPVSRHIQVTLHLYNTNVKTEKKTYLLKLHRRQGSDRWLATLQDIYTGALLHFSNERELFRYLLKELAVRLPDSRDPGGDRTDQSDRVV